jgi:polyphosphate kinase 2 (PPK2 family)
MFESAEIGHKIDKDTYKKAVPALRAALLDAQFDLKENGKIPVIVLVSGQDGAGKGETINILYEWMDPRFISTLAFSAPTDEERSVPSCGATGARCRPRAGSACSPDRGTRARSTTASTASMSQGRLDARIDQINRFEAMLVNEGALVLKFWFHLTKEGQKRRLKALEKDPTHRLARHQVELGPPQDLRQAAGRRRPRAAHDQHAVGAVDHHRRRGRPLSLADDRQDPARGDPAETRRAPTSRPLRWRRRYG